MKKKDIIILLVLSILLIILLPLIIMWLYDLGEVYPIIRTPYTESNMLDYSAAVIGAIVGAVALIYSVVANAIRFRISHAITINENNKECILICIYNDSPYECEIQSVCITNELHKHSAHIIRSKPFIVKAKSSKEFPVVIEDVRKVLKRFEDETISKKVFYELRTGTGNTIYLTADKLIQTIEQIDAHNKRYGIPSTEKQPITVRVRKKKKGEV